MEQLSNISPTSNLESEVLRNMHPQRNVFTFDNGVVISSNFDNGNLWKCQKHQEEKNVNEGDIFEISQQSTEPETKTKDEQSLKDLDYDLWIAPDSLMYTDQKTMSYRTWYFFNVTGIPCDVGTIQFKIKNMSNQRKLFDFGLKPLYYQFTQQQHNEFLKGDEGFYKLKWEKVKNKPVGKSGTEGFEVTFFHTLKKDRNPSDVIYFAFTYPFTYEDIRKSTMELEKRCKESGVYFHKRNIGLSLELRPIELITISGMNGIRGDDSEPFIEGIDNQAEEERCHAFDNKPSIFISSRVHCGETPGSYMLQGMIDLISKFEHPQSKVLLENFVFKIVPCLNPDGVSRGYWRNDTQGVNLNRFYKDPSAIKHPSIYNTKLALIHCHKYHNLKYYVDLHGHVSKRSCFVFGNTIEDKSKNIEQHLLPRLMQLNSINFDYKESSFNDEHNNKEDGKGNSREGSGRAIAHKISDLPHCFTLECNYAVGVKTNPLKQRMDRLSGKLLKTEDTYITDINSSYYKGKKTPVFNSDVFRDIGNSYLVSVLDIEKINPITRILKSPAEDFELGLERVRKEIEKDLDRSSQFKRKPVSSKFKPDFEIVISTNKCPTEEKKNDEESSKENGESHERQSKIIDNIEKLTNGTSLEINDSNDINNEQENLLTDSTLINTNLIQ